MQGTEFDEIAFFAALAGVLVARLVTAHDGTTLAFDDAWARRVTVEIGPAASAHLPCLDDLIFTKRIAQRPKDAEDVRWLETLRGKKQS